MIRSKIRQVDPSEDYVIPGALLNNVLERLEKLENLQGGGGTVVKDTGYGFRIWSQGGGTFTKQTIVARLQYQHSTYKWLYGWQEVQQNTDTGAWDQIGQLSGGRWDAGIDESTATNWAEEVNKFPISHALHTLDSGAFPDSFSQGDLVLLTRSKQWTVAAGVATDAKDLWTFSAVGIGVSFYTSRIEIYGGSGTAAAPYTYKITLGANVFNALTPVMRPFPGNVTNTPSAGLVAFKRELHADASLNGDALLLISVNETFGTTLCATS